MVRIIKDEKPLRKGDPRRPRKRRLEKWVYNILHQKRRNVRVEKQIAIHIKEEVEGKSSQWQIEPIDPIF